MAIKAIWEQQNLLIRGGNLMIIDGGANEGQTVTKYRNWWPDATVHCFEPDPRAFAILKSRWGSVSGVHLHAEALGAKEGRLQFNLGSESYVSSVFPRKDDYSGAMPMIDSVQVPVITLDEAVSRNRIPYINVLKMDLQGFELEALQGAEKLLTEEMADIIYTEVWLEPAYAGAPTYWQIAQRLAAFGYKTWGIEVEEYPDYIAEGRWGDALFISNHFSKTVNYGGAK